MFLFQSFFYSRRLLFFVVASMTIAVAAQKCFVFGIELNSENDNSQIYFETHVRPILKAHCFHCHGEEEEKQGHLDLRLVRFMAMGGDSGSALARQHNESLLYQRVASGEMPPVEKKVSPSELAVIAAWLDQGSKTMRPEPEKISEFSEDERSFWSFKPIRRSSVPKVKAGQWISTPVDNFLLQSLEKVGLGYQLPATPEVLCRRAYFDLHGLPPHPDQLAAFIQTAQTLGIELAFSRLVDRLLGSPRYGERWARHWLDIAGYADSDGYGEKDIERKFAYKYRDYVINSFNSNKPWDDFIREQLAGDEMVSNDLEQLSSSDTEKLVATGFLRMGPDGTSDPTIDKSLAANDCLAETIKIVSTSLLGLTVGCAQCHSHRYDPITHVDYHRMRAIFEPALDWKAWRTPQQRLVSLWSQEQKELANQCDARLKELNAEQTAAFEKLGHEVRERGIANLNDELKHKLRTAFSTPAANRTAEQKELLVKHPAANVPSRGDLLRRNAKEEYNSIEKKYSGLIESVQAQRPPDDYAHCLTEVRGRSHPTFLFSRGDFSQPKQEVAPGELGVLCHDQCGTFAEDDPNLPTTGRRLAYARHLTSGHHPLLVRVWINRLWLHHFGRGIVSTPSDFGVLGQRPSHPELLDWLADEFVRSGWDVKRMHRLMMLSSAYRQSSVRLEDHDRIDPENRLIGRMNIRRLDAETLRDSLLMIAGNLTNQLFGPSVPVAPDEAGQIHVGVDTRDGAGRPTGKVVPLYAQEFRRSIYVQVRRTMPLDMLDTFDGPALAPNCTIRNSSTVAPQSLMLMNNEFVHHQSEVFAAQVCKDVGKDLRTQARFAWVSALATQPTQAQLDSTVTFLESTARDLAHLNSEKEPELNMRKALSVYCQALFNSNAFLYVD